MGRKLKYIDLFCGSGGMSLGFERAGFHNIFSIDFNKDCCETYLKNFPGSTVINKEISKLSEKEIKKLIGRKKVDVIIGGPPCQGFSMAGNIGRKFLDDPRNYLFKEFARVVAIVKPTCIVIENVARLYTHNHGSTRREIIDTFVDLGYNIECKVLNAADYGVPQMRYRVVFIGTLTDKEIVFPEKCVSKYKTVEETIGDLPELKSGESSSIPNHVAMTHSREMLKKMSYVKDGGDRMDIPKRLRPQKGDVRKYIRYNSKAPSICITGDMRKVFHYKQNRALTVRELADLQSYPRDFVFLGNSISQQQQVGNSVPPVLAYHIALAIKKIIK